MEEVAEAMKEISYSQPHAIEPHVSQAPSNYAWPVYEAEHQQIHNLRQENTEYRENFRAWESEKVS